MDNRTALERFVCKIEFTENGCWNWTASLSRGYGRFTVNGKNIYAHRWSYQQTNGEIPEGMVLDHLCSNRRCVNPEHLEVVTQSENLSRSKTTWYSLNKAKTHCVNGHPFDKVNTQIQKGGRRRCRECGRIRSIYYRERGK
jgi:hypothetical protein